MPLQPLPVTSRAVFLSHITANTASSPIPGRPKIPAVRAVTALMGKAMPVKAEMEFSSQRHRNPKPEWISSFSSSFIGSRSIRIRVTEKRAGISSVTNFSIEILRIKGFRRGILTSDRKRSRKQT